MSGPRCTVCSHEARGVIDKLIASGASSARAIAHRYGLSKDAIRRHGNGHIVKAVARAMRRRAERREDEVTDVFSARLEAAHAAATRALERSECEPDGWKYAALLIGQVFRGVELLGRATGRLDGQAARKEAIHVNALIVMPGTGARAVAGPTIELKPLAIPDGD
jgi:hypothetical protein